MLDVIIIFARWLQRRGFWLEARARARQADLRFFGWGGAAWRPPVLEPSPWTPLSLVQLGIDNVDDDLPF